MGKEKLVERIKDKIEELEKDLGDFSDFEIPEMEEYRENIVLKAACERYFEKIVENLIALAFLIIRLKEFNSPETEEQAFFILSKNKIITGELAKRLKEAKDMRNIIIHNYIKVDDSIVYHAIADEIKKDAEEFLEVIKNEIK